MVQKYFCENSVIDIPRFLKDLFHNLGFVHTRMYTMLLNTYPKVNVNTGVHRLCIILTFAGMPWLSERLACSLLCVKR